MIHTKDQVLNELDSAGARLASLAADLKACRTVLQAKLGEPPPFLSIDEYDGHFANAFTHIEKAKMAIQGALPHLPSSRLPQEEGGEERKTPMSTARTWQCPQCGLSLEISYDQLAEHGGPVCDHCDCDMELQPADNDTLLAELTEIGQELLAWADTMGGWEAKCWTRLRAAMKEVPVAEKESPKTAEELIERLVDKADAAGLQPEEFDEAIHEFAAGVAADVNNGGLEDQIRYLVEGSREKRCTPPRRAT